MKYLVAEMKGNGAAGGCGTVRYEFTRKVINMCPKVYHAKRYDYVAKKSKKKQCYKVYRREWEETPWEKIYEIPFDALYKPERWYRVPGAFSIERLDGKHRMFSQDGIYT